MHHRDVASTATNILEDMENEWIIDGPFRKRSELHDLTKTADSEKIVTGLKRLLKIQEELLKRKISKSPISRQSGIERQQEQIRLTNEAMERWIKIANI